MQNGIGRSSTGYPTFLHSVAMIFGTVAKETLEFIQIMQ